MIHDLNWWINISLSLLVVQIVIGSWWLIGPGKKLVDGGWAWGRLSGWLFVSLLIWWASHLMATNSLWVVRGVMSGLLSVLSAIVIKKRKEWREQFKKKWRFILTEEVLFFIGLLGMGIVRGFKPEILGLEKFMDAGFINSYLESTSLPVEDMWFAGGTINYYSFGHFMGSTMLKWWGVGIGVGYNLLLALLAGLIFSGSFSVSANLISLKDQVIEKKVLIGGFVSSLLVVLGGNSHTLWYGLSNRGWKGYWYADATRFIENSIHEFASYSLVVSDLHAHLWALPIVLFLLFLMIGWYKSGNKIIWEIGWGILVGVLVMTNTWDVMVYGLLLLIWTGWLMMKDEIESKVVIRAGLVTLGMAGLVSMGWWLNFSSIGQGIEVVENGSLLWQMAVLWGGHGVLTIIAIRKGWLKNNLLIASMGMGALVLILIPELVYLKDIYPTHPRANTMFKLTYQAMLWMSLLGGYVLAAGEKIEKAVTIVLSICFLSFAWFAYRDFYYFKSYQGIDGEGWIKQEYTDDWKGIEWLRKNIKRRPVVLEAVGESYTKYARVSVFSGKPTVLGWRVHEWLWRGGFEKVAERTEEVRVIYENTNSQEAENILEKHQVEYIFWGEKENEKYDVDEKAIRDLGEVVFKSGKTEVIEITD